MAKVKFTVGRIDGFQCESGKNLLRRMLVTDGLAANTNVQNSDDLGSKQCPASETLLAIRSLLGVVRYPASLPMLAVSASPFQTGSSKRRTGSIAFSRAHRDAPHG